MFRRQQLILLAGVAVSAAQFAPSAGSAVDNESRDSDASDVGITEVVVTARRREESLQSVPVSINAFGAAALEARSLRTLTDLTAASPGLRFSSEGTTYTSSVSMRGLGKNAASTTGTPSVVLYFAEVPVPGDNLNIPTFDMESIQVLKGPQGTLFGRNTIGGAILLTPQAPTFTAEGYVRATYGNLDYEAIEGAVNVPLVADKVALRVAGQMRRRDGYVHDLTYDDRLDDVHQDSARVSLLLQLTESLSNTTVFDYFRAREKGNGYVLFRVNQLPGLEFLDPQLLAARDAQRANGVQRTTSAVADPYTRPEFWGITNTTALDVNGVLLKNIFGYRVNDIQIRGNFDGLPPLFDDQVALYKTLAARNNDRSITDEFQIQGEVSDIGLDYLMGAFYSKLEPNGVRGITNRSFDFFGSTPLTAASTYATVESKALFGQVGYDLSALAPGLKINAGVRHTWTDTEVCGATRVNPPAPTGFYTEQDCRALAAAGSVGILRRKENRPTWTIGLDYQASDALFAYVVSRRGYREGGINTPLFNSPNTTGDPDAAGLRLGADLRPYQTYEPETLTDIELGLKSTFHAGEVAGTFNIALFRSWYKDAVQYISVAGFVDPDSGFPDRGSFGYNSGKLIISGVEVDTSIVPVHGLTVSVSASYLHQKVDAVNTVPPFPTPSITLPSPEWSAAAALDYVLPLDSSDDLVLHGDYSYLGDYQVQGTDVPGYELVNFRFDWKDVGDSGFSAGIFVKNALDKEYVAGPHLFLRQFPPNAAIFGEPRNYGLELTYRY